MRSGNEPSRFSRRGILKTGVLALGASPLLAACTAPAASPTPQEAPTPVVVTKEVIKEVPKEVVKEVVKEVPKEVQVQVTKVVQQRTVSFWHIFSTIGAQADAMKAVIAEFEKTHSGIKIVENVVQREDIKVLAPSVMRSTKAPDVIQYRVISTARVGYDAGLCMDLSDLWAKNNWEKEFGPLSPNGKWKGKYWNIPWSVDSFPGYWYISEDWAKRGYKEPKTIAEFETILADYKKNGVAPLLVANIEKWHMPYNVEYMILGMGGRKIWNGLGDGSVKWTDDKVTASFAKLSDWLQKGYYYPNMNAYKLEEVFPFWLGGKAALIPGGSWLITTAETNKMHTSYFQHPAASADIENAVVASTEPFSIPAKAEHPDEAKELLTFLASKEAQQIFATVALQPMANVNVDHSKLPEVVQKNVNDVKKGPVVLGFDWDLPEPVFTQAWAGIQQLADKPSDATIQKVLGDVQKVADEYFSKKP
jgi:multiple sugar transport system substrate-binding protein